MVEAFLDGVAGDHAVAARLLRRHFHDGDDRTVRLLVGMDELADARPVGRDDVVGQDDGEWLVAYQVLRHEHRVAKAQLLLLPHVRDLGEVADVADLAELLDLALLLEKVLELVRQVEVILDRPLLAARDEDDLLDPGSDRLLDGVLNDRLVNERQHLLGECLRRREEAGAPARDWKEGFSDAHRTSEIGRAGRRKYTRSLRATLLRLRSAGQSHPEALVVRHGAVASFAG